MKLAKLFLYFVVMIFLSACAENDNTEIANDSTKEKELHRTETTKYIVVSRADYQNKLHGFWLGQSIANWTGLVTEMDKIGNIGVLSFHH